MPDIGGSWPLNRLWSCTEQEFLISDCLSQPVVVGLAACQLQRPLVLHWLAQQRAAASKSCIMQ